VDPGREPKGKMYPSLKGRVQVTKYVYPAFLSSGLHWDSGPAPQKGWGSVRTGEPALLQAFNAVFIALILSISV